MKKKKYAHFIRFVDYLGTYVDYMIPKSTTPVNWTLYFESFKRRRGV